MTYNELIQFEPLNEVVKFHRLNEEQYRREMVSSYVFSDTYERTIIPEICNNLDYTSSVETFGMQIVGTYGTGKSHLMSLFSLIAENEDYLSLVNNEIAKKSLEKIAGKYKVVRFELGATLELWDLVCFQIDSKLKDWGIEYSISADNQADMYKNKLMRMMAQFEEAYPDKGLMIVIDEMLSYLKGRSGSDSLNRDLAVLQTLGEFCDHSKFRMVFGVQEMIYTVPEFQFAANMLEFVHQRYRQYEITKQDVKFVTEQRILKKTEEQKSLIRRHLERFTAYFTDMHANIEDYVNLFPVNPSFFDNFQLINVAKSQREILRTLSSKFAAIANEQVPDTEPGLICYDSYWLDLNIPSMHIYSDIRRLSKIVETINSKIDDNFTGARERKKILAHRIVNACAIKILQDTLEKTNGISAERLVEDLCYLENGCTNRDFLVDIIDTTAKQIVQSTAGQYFVKNDINQEYHLRIEGGVNYEQRIKDFVSTMTPSNKDSHFYSFLVENLPIEVEQCRREFKIFPHQIEWISHKVMLDGYIFMGNPSERSTTHPEQYFYIYFMPIFNEENMAHGDEPDSVYFHLDKVSNETKGLLELYAASEALIASVDSSQKQFYNYYKNQYLERLKTVFDYDFTHYTEVVYQGKIQNTNPAMMSGGSREEVVSKLASSILEEHFCQRLKDYPKFTLLPYSLTPSNRANHLKGARLKIANPTEHNQNGEAILAGLGLLKENQLNVDESIYALSIRQLLESKEDGRVLNRDEILHKFYENWSDDWRSNDYNLEADLEFIVLTAMVAMGEIDINYSGGKSINATNLKDIVDISKESFYSFSNVQRPKDMNIAAIRVLFEGITGKNMASKLQDKSIYIDLVNDAKKIASNAAQCLNTLSEGLSINGVKLFSEDFSLHAKTQLMGLKGLCDKIQNYASPAKIRHLPWTEDALRNLFDSKKYIESIKQTKELYEIFLPLINYLSQAIEYMPNGNLKDKTIKCVNRLGEIIEVELSDTKIKDYKSELDSLKKDYIKWYLSEYKRFHISELQNSGKHRLVNDSKNSICKSIYESDKENRYFPAFDNDYFRWIESINQLKVVDSSVNEDYLSNVPYASFNPLMFEEKSLPSINDLTNNLDEICNSIDEAFHEILKDEKLLENVSLLNDSQSSLLQNFNNGRESLSQDNAIALYKIVHKLHQKVKSITITMNEIHKVLNRPMTPDDTVEAFRKYINDICKGKDTNNVRIILK